MIKKKNLRLLFIIIIVAAIAVIGISRNRKASDTSSMQLAHTESEGEKIAYYTCGMHPSVRVFAEEFKKGNTLCPICNMKLIPVYKEGAVREDKTKKILFYRHPMNPAITSVHPAKDEMGMDYVPVYEEVTPDGEYYGCGMEGEEHVFQIKDAKNMKCPFCGMPLKKLSRQEAEKLLGVVSRVKIKGEQARLAGVKTRPVEMRHLYKKIRTVGRVAYDPQLAIAQEEFISSVKSLDKIQQGNIPEIKERAIKLMESAKRKLLLSGLSNEQIEELKEARQVQGSLVLPEEKMWIYGDVYEYELPWIKEGQEVKVTTVSLPGEEFSGVISSVNPVLDPKTRSLRFRAQVDNPGLKLKPEMYVDIVIMSRYASASGDHMVLAIPKDAVLDTGARKIIWVDKGNGEYEGREIQIGPEANTIIDEEELRVYPMLRGASEGEMVVTKANFLIDSQSQITGVAASAYGGTIGAEEEKTPPAAIHQH